MNKSCTSLYGFGNSFFLRISVIMLIGLAWGKSSQCGGILGTPGSYDLETIKAFVKDDPHFVFTKDLNGWTPLHLAAIDGKRDVVEFLLAHKADVGAKTDASHGFITEFMLISSGIYPEPPLLPSFTTWVNRPRCEYIGIQTSDTTSQLVESLLAHGGNLNISGNLISMPRQFPAFENDSIKLDLHLVNTRDLSVVTPIRYVNVLEWRLTGEDVFNTYGFLRSTPLHLAAAAGHLDVVQLLLANKAEVDALDDNGMTPLSLAAAAGRKNVVELLLANNASVNARDNNGDTPLHLAAAAGHTDVVESLIFRWANVNAHNDKGDTPLHIAVSKGNRNVAELLIAMNADVNAKNNLGETPLLMALLKSVPFYDQRYNIGLSTGPEPEVRNYMAELLRRHGAVE